jgi:hypothetical protein
MAQKTSLSFSIRQLKNNTDFSLQQSKIQHYEPVREQELDRKTQCRSKQQQKFTGETEQTRHGLQLALIYWAPAA